MEMKIIAVNISRLLDRNDLTNLTKIQTATERAWKLNELKFRKNLPEFVIGVASGIIHGYYKFENVNPDHEPKRVKFTLTPCDKKDRKRIDLFTKNKNLKYFVIKHKW